MSGVSNGKFAVLVSKFYGFAPLFEIELFLSTEKCIHFEDYVDSVTCTTTHDEEKAISYVTFPFFEFIFCLLDSIRLYSSSTVNLFGWDKMGCIFIRRNDIPLLFTKMAGAVISALKRRRPLAPLHESPMDLHDMYDV